MNVNDVNLLKIILEFIFNKMEILINGIESKEKASEGKECMNMAIDITKRKTYKQLIKGITSHVCGIFGYKDVAILFYDPKEDTLFTLPMNLDQKQEITKHMKLSKALLMTAPPSPKGNMNRTLKLTQT